MHQNFFLKLFSHRFLFFNLVSSIFLLYHIIEFSLCSNTPLTLGFSISYGFSTGLALLIHFFLLVRWGQVEKEESKIFMGVFIFLLIVSFFATYVQRVLEHSDTKNSLIGFEELILTCVSMKIIHSLKLKLFIFILLFMFFSFEWGLFVNELSFSLICTLVAFLLVLHLLSVSDPTQRSHSRRISFGPQTHDGSRKSIQIISNDNVRSLKELKKVPTLQINGKAGLKSLYSQFIVNAIKEGLIVFDRNFRIKWHNSYLKKLFPNHNSQQLEEKILSIKQDENFLRLSNTFLKFKSEYTQLFKAFQVKIEPLKSMLDQDFLDYSDKNKQSPLLSHQKQKSLSREMSFNPRRKSNTRTATFFPNLVKASSHSESEGAKLKFQHFLNKNLGFGMDHSDPILEMNLQTLRDYLQQIIEGMTTSLGLISSEAFNFQKYNMYGSLTCEDDDHKKLFFIRFFPYNDEIVVVLKYMPDNDLVIAAMNDATNQNKLFASMCHELRTPLNFMTNILEMMRNDMKAKIIDKIEESEHHEYVENALVSSKLLISSVNDFLDFFSVSSNIFSLSFTEFDLEALMKECFELFTFVSEKKGIAYYFDFKANIQGNCVNDAKRLQQIVLNLLGNAFKYTNAGCITLKAQKKANFDLIQISVKDTGGGIPKDILRNLGKISPNSSSSSTTGGFGISISNQLANYIGPNVKSHSTSKYKGFYKGLKVRTEVGKGTKFAFLIPYRKDKMEIYRTESVECITEKINSRSFSSLAVSEHKEREFIFGENETEYKFLDKVSLNVKTNSGDTSFKGLDTAFFATDEGLTSCKCPQILGVDDNHFNLFALKERFKKKDIAIDVCQSGEETIHLVSQILRQNEHKFCSKCRFYRLILMDIDMPIKNGYETTKELIKMFKETSISAPILALSAFGETQNKEKAFEAGMKEFIEKPLTQAKLEFLCKNYLDCSKN